MTKKKTSIKFIGLALFFILVSQFACSLFGGQRIYEDPEHVDYSAEETATPEVQAPVEEPDTAEAEVVEPETTEVDASEPDEVASPEDESYFEQDGIRLYYDPQLVLDVEPPSESVPGSSGDEMYEVAHPAFVHFDLYMEQAQVYVAPVQEYKASADFAPTTISELETMLSQKPTTVEDCVPELPLSDFFRVCDHQQFNSNIGYFDFQNGSGVRFVSVYGIQDIAPVDNEHLVYVFQGFTSDGKYYLKIIVRLLHDQLPDVNDIPEDVYTATDASVVGKYFDDFELLLNQNEADFSPALDWIDAFIKSLRVE